MGTYAVTKEEMATAVRRWYQAWVQANIGAIYRERTHAEICLAVLELIDRSAPLPVSPEATKLLEQLQTVDNPKQARILSEQLVQALQGENDP